MCLQVLQVQSVKVQSVTDVFTSTGAAFTLLEEQYLHCYPASNYDA